MTGLGCLAGVGALTGVGAGVLLIIVAFMISPVTAAIVLVGIIAITVALARRLLRFSRAGGGPIRLAVKPTESDTG